MARNEESPGSAAPTMQPPVELQREGQSEGGSAAVGTSEPKRVTDALIESFMQTQTSTTEPKLHPPGTLAASAAVEAAGGVTGTWRSGGLVTGMWSINETRNAWMLIDGVGWRKLYNGRDGAFMALTSLAAQARQTGRSINYREEADGMIYEIYLW
jgi:hypothetical protein